jgi:cation diffusion facilitator CzcD-associated flavoprotein CzcO
MRVAVIGAGAAGLCAARHLMKHFRISVFEQASAVGGTWVYTDQTGRDDAGCLIHSSMYANLRQVTYVISKFDYLLILYAVIEQKYFILYRTYIYI